jgi:hypothetical protein
VLHILVYTRRLIFPSKTCFRGQFLRKMWPIQLDSLLFIILIIINIKPTEFWMIRLKFAQFMDVRYTVRSESRCALTLRYIRTYGTLRTLVDITSNIFYKCTTTFRTQICRTCLRIKLKGFRLVQTLVDITSNTFGSAQRLFERTVFQTRYIFCAK